MGLYINEIALFFMVMKIKSKKLIVKDYIRSKTYHICVNIHTKMNMFTLLQLLL